MGEVRKLWIPGPCGKLEAAMRFASPTRALALVAHPHPLHGGTLHNPVVFHAERRIHGEGSTTLRFNFRGVGTSDGEHDEGRGEVQDVAAAAAWLRGVAPDTPLVLVGYSFGSLCVIRHAIGDRAVRGVVAIGLPVRLYDIETAVGGLEQPLVVVQGELDEFGSPQEVGELLATAAGPTRLLEIEGATHLFPDRARDAAERVAEATRIVLSRSGSAPPGSDPRPPHRRPG